MTIKPESERLLDKDGLLIKRIRQGDDGAFDLFVRKYYEAILRYCAYHCYNDETAKDLTQDTFLRFFSSLPDYVHRNKAKNYLYKIASNLCKNYYKKKKEQPTDNAIDNIFNRSAEEGYEQNITTQLTVRACLGQLNDDYREVMILYFYQDLKQSEIAAVLGIGLPLVKYRLKKGKEQMKKLMGEEL